MKRTMTNAFQMGALAAECNLDRDTNPFQLDSQDFEDWDAGYSKSIDQWRAQKRADIADDYGDEAADMF
jgi:hypothetical protein